MYSMRLARTAKLQAASTWPGQAWHRWNCQICRWHAWRSCTNHLDCHAARDCAICFHTQSMLWALYKPFACRCLQLQLHGHIASQPALTSPGITRITLTGTRKGRCKWPDKQFSTRRNRGLVGQFRDAHEPSKSNRHRQPVHRRAGASGLARQC